MLNSSIRISTPWLVGILTSLTLLCLSCESAPLAERLKKPKSHPDVACIIDGAVGECVFDQGETKTWYRKGRSKLASTIAEIDGWACFPHDLYLDLLRKYPETSD